MEQEVLNKIRDFGYMPIDNRDIEENGGYLFIHAPLGILSVDRVELRYWTAHPRMNITINGKQIYESGITTNEKLLKFMEDTHHGWQEK